MNVFGAMAPTWFDAELVMLDAVYDGAVPAVFDSARNRGPTSATASRSAKRTRDHREMHYRRY
jgi:hypothetical protein